MITDKTADLLAKILGDSRYVRMNSGTTKTRLADLSLCHADLIWFCEKYEGPFWSKKLGLEMLDAIEGVENICTATELCRSLYGFPSQYAVLSGLVAGQAILLDCKRDRVFEVDFEGGDKLLVADQLPLRWRGFEDFLLDYFSEG